MEPHEACECHGARESGDLERGPAELTGGEVEAPQRHHVTAHLVAHRVVEEDMAIHTGGHSRIARVVDVGMPHPPCIHHIHDTQGQGGREETEGEKKVHDPLHHRNTL